MYLDTILKPCTKASLWYSEQYNNQCSKCGTCCLYTRLHNVFVSEQWLFQWFKLGYVACVHDDILTLLSLSVWVIHVAFGLELGLEKKVIFQDELFVFETCYSFTGCCFFCMHRLIDLSCPQKTDYLLFVHFSYLHGLFFHALTLMKPWYSKHLSK